MLVDPYGVVSFSLPIKRPVMSDNQRAMYFQIVRGGQFDSLIVGTSTAMLIDPASLNEPFGARFVNLAMPSATAWEQRKLVRFFLHEAGTPKVLVVALDRAWCETRVERKTDAYEELPDWLYDGKSWNRYLYLLNRNAAQIALRLALFNLGFGTERIRSDGFAPLFLPPDNQYDPVRAQREIWNGRAPTLPPARPPVSPGPKMRTFPFPALDWLDDILAQLPAATTNVLALMPVHVAAQAWPGTQLAVQEDECKDRIEEVARRRGASMVDWRIASAITRTDENYWDALHYRLPIAQKIARDLAGAVFEQRRSDDNSYRLVVP